MRLENRPIKKEAIETKKNGNNYDIITISFVLMLSCQVF